MEAGSKIKLRREDYTVGWICALPTEQSVAIAMLDEHHEHLPKAPGDKNNYNYGSIHGHNVVIACLPSGRYGTSSAASVAEGMMRSFRIRVGLMVGIGGGVPKHDVRLGDVVISHPSGKYSGVMQYDFGKAMSDGSFLNTGSLSSPRTELLTALSNLRSSHDVYGNTSSQYIVDMVERHPLMSVYASRDNLEDVLFSAEDIHPEENDSCEACKAFFDQVERSEREPTIHFGLIASGNQVMKDGKRRDAIEHQIGEKVLCFEMEAAGLMSDFQCLIVRGICDYSDSHKNKAWQKYAAAIAGACAKDFLKFVDPEEVSQMPVAKVGMYMFPFFCAYHRMWHLF
jgi:nucleoside phosphorylase